MSALGSMFSSPKVPDPEPLPPPPDMNVIAQQAKARLSSTGMKTRIFTSPLGDMSNPTTQKVYLGD